MDSKSWYQSKTIWGGLVTIVGIVGTVVQQGGTPSPENIMAFVGAVMAIYGRVVAKSTIG